MWLRNEWSYMLRQPLCWLVCIVLPVVALLFAQGIGGIDTLANKRLQALHMTLLMMSLPLLIGVLAPLIFLRDRAHDMTELIFATPQSQFSRLFVRFMMLLLLSATLLLLSFMIMWLILTQTFGFQWHLVILSLWDFIFLALPSCAVFSALACCLAQRFNSSVVTYVFFCMVWLMYVVLASMTGSPMLAGSTIVSSWLFTGMRWLDPFGITPLLNFYQNTELKLYGDPVFYVNRLAYCFTAVVLFFSSLKLQAYNRDLILPLKNSVQTSLHNLTYQCVIPSPHAGKQVLQLSLMCLSTLLKQRLSQFILLIWTLQMFNEVMSGINYAEPLSVIHPTSLDALNRITDDVLPLMGSFLVLLWSWQLNWRNRHTAMAELIATTPVRSGILLSSHVLALSSLIVLLMLLTAAATLIAERTVGSTLQPTQYLIQLSTVGLSLIVLGTIFTALHTLCRSPLLATTCCVGILVMKYTPLSGILGLTHTLWNIAASPLQPADAYWGLEQSLSVHFPFMMFWLVFTFSLLLVTAQYSHRGTSFKQLQAWKIKPTSTLMLVLTFFLGLNLHNNIKNERPLMSSDLREQWRVNYELQYASWAKLPQPVISHIDAQVDIFPYSGEANFSLTYKLKNATQQPIEKILIGSDTATPLQKLELSAPHTRHYDAQLAQYVMVLHKALDPDEQISLEADFTFKQPKHWPAVMHQLIKPSFSYLRGAPLLPTIGFQPQYQLQDEQLRQENNLVPLRQTKPSVLFVTPLSAASYDWITLHSVVSTAAEQTPLAQGKLIKEWQQGARHYREYQTTGPIRNMPVWFSQTQHSLRRQVGSTLLEVFGEKNSAAQLNLQAMQDTLEWMNSHIAPYRGETLSLLAAPDFGPTGYALPQMIMISHRVGFRAEPAPDAGFDQRYRRVVHETAHQWFGHALGNGVLTDKAFLVESMAKYIELVMLEQRYGVDAMQALVDYERQRYKVDVMRNTEQIKALVDATESYDMYSRATLVFAILREQLGDEVITAALRQLWQRHAYPNTPATSMDFVRAIKSQVDDEQQQLVDSLLLDTDIQRLLQD